MRKFVCLLSLLWASLAVVAQKKPLDHSVYDGWQNINERYISNDGRWVVYTITPQEGDATLVIQATDHTYKKEIPRGYGATITEDNRFVICRIRPLFKATRDARIKKNKSEDMPKDSLAIIEAGKDSVVKIARVKSYKTPEKGVGPWMAYLSEKALPVPPAQPDSGTRLNNMVRMADSLARVADSLRNKANEAKTKGLGVLKPAKTENKSKPAEVSDEGTELVLRNLYTGEEKRFPLVRDYYFNKKGTVLIVETTRSSADTLVQATVLWHDLTGEKTNTVMRRFNDAKNYGIDEDGKQLAFIAERDSATKSIQKFYKLWYYRPGMDSAQMRADRNTEGVTKGLTISESAMPEFSNNGQRLFFGLVPIRKPKDTTLVDFEIAKLDIWHYNDDYLQPQQLVQLPIELQRSYKAVLNGDDTKVARLGSDSSETIVLADEGNAPYVLATSTKGARVEAQWLGFAQHTGYIISTTDGTRKLVKAKQRGLMTLSPKGKYVLWYDAKERNYFTYNIGTGKITNITQPIKVPLYDEEDDHPDDPPAHGWMKWHEDDAYVYVYDKYDVWQCDPDGVKAPRNIFNGYGRANKIIYRYMQSSRDEKFIANNQKMAFRMLVESTKYSGISICDVRYKTFPQCQVTGPWQPGFQFLKAKNADKYIYTKESFTISPMVVVGEMKMQDVAQLENRELFKDSLIETVLEHTNPQQKDYNWLTAELVKWKMFDGKMSEGLLFKPENFDPKKKYPVLFYFYERNADGLYLYRPPTPSASIINIPYFVSNGYLVFIPDIFYKKGEPGESAYNSVVSAAKYLSKMPFVDSTKMGIQGQSWGGYQVAYLVTRTNLFAAAGAGAPVSNMTSAYGGIRWQTGLNRQFQYERTQSRIGATLWQRPDLYIKNSPLFRADKVKTPLLIMHNDADGAVPWYQGIELFTALRRLGKKVWMLQYNGENHNLMERRNQKDLSIRLAQFFDHYLKGAPAARWIIEGLPAIQKGIEWGTEVEEKKAF
jgi:dienelactone hydrolase